MFTRTFFQMANSYGSRGNSARSLLKKSPLADFNPFTGVSKPLPARCRSILGRLWAKNFQLVRLLFETASFSTSS